jgi:hypothetical protein
MEILMYRENKLIGFKSENFIDILISSYENIIDGQHIKYPYTDKALNICFKMYKDNIGEVLDGIIWDKYENYPNIELYDFICGDFCKIFRQVDIIKDDTHGLSDMLIWNLINGSRYIDSAIKASCEYYERQKSGEWNKHMLSDIVERL